MRAHRAWALAGVNQIRTSCTQPRVINHIIGIIIGIAAIIAHATLIIGGDQAVQPVIAINPRAARIWRGDRTDLAGGTSRISQVLQRGCSTAAENAAEEATLRIISVGAGHAIALGLSQHLAARIIRS